MSEEFLKVARQEIQSEIDSLNEIFLTCTNDEQLHEKSIEIAKHMHKIKGLAPMMEQEKVGEVAKISDLVLKHVSSHGTLKGSHKITSDAVKIMFDLFSGQVNIQIDGFRKQVRESYPQITGF